MKDKAKTKAQLLAEVAALRQQVLELESVIATHQQAEAALQRSEEQFRLLFEHAPLGIALIRPDYSVIANKFLADFLGYPLADIEALPVFELVERVTHPDDLPMETLLAQKIMLNEISSYRLEKRYIKKNSEIVWGDLTVLRLPNQIRDTVLSISMVLDMTEHKRVEAALRESEARYRSLFEDSPISLWEEDFSGVKAHLDRLSQAGVDDFEAYFKQHPETIQYCAGLVKIIDVNQATLKLYQIQDKRDFQNFAQMFQADTAEYFKKELLAVANGQLRFTSENVTNVFLQGIKKFVNVSWSVAPGYEDSYAKVLVSLVDVTEQRRVEAENRRRLAQLETLRHIGLELTTELNLDTLLESIVLRAIELLEAKTGGIYLYRPETDVLELTVSIGSPNGPRGLTLRCGEGVAGQVWATGQPVIIDNYQTWAGRAAFYEGYAFTTIMGVPIQLGQEFLGALNVINRPSPFSPADVELLTLFAGQAAIAIRNAQLVASLQESEGRYRSLFEDSPIALWEEDFSAVKTYLEQLRNQGVTEFEAYFEQNVEVVRYCIQLIRLLDANQKALKMSQTEDKAEVLAALDQIIAPPSLKGFKKELIAIAQGKTKLEYENITQNLKGDRLYSTITWTVAPGYEETYAKVLVSVIDMTQRKQAEEALQQSEHRYRDLAQQNARLYVEAQQRLKEQTALLEATRVISSSLDFLTVLKGIAEQMGQAIDATSTYICDYEPKTMTVTVMAEYFSPQACPAERVSHLEKPYSLRLDFSDTIEFLQAGCFKIRQFDDPSLDEYKRAQMQQYGAKTILSLPLQVRGQTIACAELWESRQQRQFTPQEIALCQGIAQQAAIAIENARLLEQARRDAATKAVLLEEVNHRVKNNLMAIVGLLYAERQRSGLEDQAAFQATMQDLINRVQGLSTVHTLLSAAEWGPLSLPELARQVIASALQSLPSDKRVRIEVSPASVRVTPQQANNLALVINELTTNTVKYGGLEQDSLQITINIKREDDLILFEFKNNGLGYPPEVLNLGYHNVGLYLIQNIVRKGLHGEVNLANNAGAVTTIRFPVSVDERAKNESL